jgi:hypothetical protein
VGRPPTPAELASQDRGPAPTDKKAPRRGLLNWGSDSKTGGR